MPICFRAGSVAPAISALLGAITLVTLASVGDAQSSADEAALFETKVRPLLAGKCYSCHGPLAKGGLRLDSREALLKGGRRGAAAIAGNPDASPLVQAVRYNGALKMPPNRPLSPAEVDVLAGWVKRGALWPKQVASGFASNQPGVAFASGGAAVQTNHWSFLPVKRPAVPKTKLQGWIKSPLDAFVLSGLEAKGLTPAVAAERRTLIRRATFDLTGLPPTPEQVDAFLADRTPIAWEKVVDSLLASPRYGERWGRHWLDVARYADSADARGLGGEGDISEAWRYRDWVIDAFNRDMPYTDFIVNQIAGDLLPAAPNTPPTPQFWGDRLKQGAASPPKLGVGGFALHTPPESGAGGRLGAAQDLNVSGTIATGLLAIGNWGNGDADKDKILTDIADDQVDIVSRGFMGLTIGCARCHDHKFDPISTKDYYGLAGIFFSTHILPKLTPKGAGETPLRVSLDTAADRTRRTEYAAKVARLEKEAQDYRAVQLRAYAHGLLPLTAKYLTADWDYSHLAAADKGLSLADFAARRGLQSYALRQWQDYLSLNDYRLMGVPFEKPLGVEGVYGYHGAADLPSMTVNANNDAKMILTFTLPPHSVCVHPGPTSGAAVGWKSPFTGLVEISGRVVDADPACGNGVEWKLDHRGLRGPVSLASGGFENGGNQDIAQGKGGALLKQVQVHEGDSIELLVLPKGDHSCDTTVVDLTIRDSGGARVWNLTKDIATGPVRSNPHGDAFGHADTWRFYDMGSGKGGAAVPDPGVAAWHKAVATLGSAPTDVPAERARIESAAQAFQATFALDDSRSPFWINRPEDEAALAVPVHDRLAKQSAELADLRKNAPAPTIFANAAQEGGCPESPHAGFHDVRVHIRGNYARLGDLVPRHFPTVLAGDRQEPIMKGSGRLELARWIASDTNPLTARVMVNRIWQHHFGQGIVRTPSNFGKLGERPSNQPLLDYLASEFVRSGWSIKQMHRLILLSAAYRQSSVAPPHSLRFDPDNHLFGRMNRMRLEAEALRDNLLSVSGRLDVTMGGPAYRDFNTPRRSVYLMTIRSDRSGFGPLFDAADPTATMDHRTNSNVAPQALFLMNDPFAIAQTKTLAKRLMGAAADDPQRIATAYRLLYGRPPTSSETAIGVAFLGRMLHKPQEKSAATPNDEPGMRAWQAYSQILLCANEFLYLD